MRTITTREQLLVNGKVRERIATHIVTGAHGYETLCRTTAAWRLQIVVWQNMSFQSNHPE
ncbi:TPA: hypothetical protein QI016_004729 [Escherichia coli]|nr:hypothetical protein [Escherichia coli]